MPSQSDFELFALPEEHRQLRAIVRSLAEKQIEPHAASVDEQSRFPEEAYQALVAAGFHAPQIPDAYGGEGADAVATCIVIEEITRVCASSALITAVNKLETMGLILSGSESLKKVVLPDIVQGGLGVICALRTRGRF